MSGKDKKQDKKRAQGSCSKADNILDAQILEKLSTSIHDDIKMLKEELKVAIKTVREELSKATKSLNAVWDKIQSLKMD